MPIEVSKPPQPKPIAAVAGAAVCPIGMRNCGTFSPGVSDDVLAMHTLYLLDVPSHNLSRLYDRTCNPNNKLI